MRKEFDRHCLCPGPDVCKANKSRIILLKPEPVIAVQESELRPLREAYEATQAALQVERKISAEAAERMANLEDECEALRQRLTHLSTVRH